MRQAVRAALDIPEIIQANQLPLSARLNSLIAKEMGQGYWADAPEYARDVAMAKSLLAAAGVSGLTLEIAAPEITDARGLPERRHAGDPVEPE